MTKRCKPQERILLVHCPFGAALRLGPGDNFEPRQILPDGMTVRALPVPSYAAVPGWICVEAELFHGQVCHGWIDVALVEDVAD